MPGVVFIVGLPASGKTHLAQTYVADGYVLFDDPSAADLPVIRETLQKGHDVVITDPSLCYGGLRCKAESEFLGYEHKWVYFENDPIQCHVNARTRPDKKVDNLIRALTKQYLIPEGVVPIPVWRDDPANNSIVAQ